MARRADSLPAPAERRILEGATDNPSASPRTQLAASIRRLNAKLSRLTPEQQRELMGDWHVSWDQLEQRRKEAADDAAALVAIGDWEREWRARLG